MINFNVVHYITDSETPQAGARIRRQRKRAAVLCQVKNAVFTCGWVHF